MYFKHLPSSHEFYPKEFSQIFLSDVGWNQSFSMNLPSIFTIFVSQWPQMCPELPMGDRFVDLGPWRLAAWDDEHLSIANRAPWRLCFGHGKILHETKNNCDLFGICASKMVVFNGFWSQKHGDFIIHGTLLGWWWYFLRDLTIKIHRKFWFHILYQKIFDILT